MTTQHLTTLRTALETAYINGATASSLAYRPQFVSNNHKEGKKVLSSVEDELLACDQFQISVAFITMSGITPLLQTLKELEKKNIPGEILTTNYLNFSEPRALKKLNELKNITLKMYNVEAAKEFVKAASECDFDIDVYYNRFLIDAKSILGVLSLDLTRELTVDCHGESREFDRTLKKFAVA